MTQKKNLNAASPSARTAAARTTAERMAAARKPKRKPIRIALIAVFVAIVAAIAIIAVSVTQGIDRSTAAADGASVVRENSHILDQAPDGKVTLVEFLDFE